jgi:hypothetical protein
MTSDDDAVAHSKAAGIVFQRELLRIGGGREVAFTAHLVGHPGCWRPGLQFMVDTYAPYFSPWVEDAAAFEGLGGYVTRVVFLRVVMAAFLRLTS